MTKVINMSLDAASIDAAIQEIREYQDFVRRKTAEFAARLADDGAVQALAEILPLMLELAEVEKATSRLADEIEKTRRRVNALEYVMIPQFDEAIHNIQMKLEENERGNTSRLMKTKEMLAKEA